MNLLTDNQETRIKSLVRLHHASLIVEIFGDRAVPKNVLKSLKSHGLYRKPRADVLRRAFQLGKLGTTVPDVLSMKSREFDAFIKKIGDMLSTQEMLAVKALRAQLQHYMSNVAELCEERFDEAIEKANETLAEELAPRERKELFLEAARRKSMSQLASDVQKSTVTLVGNVSRIVSTETNNAYQSGRAIEIIQKAGPGVDPRVFKRPRRDACPECKKAYLKDDGKTPKVFLLSELMANGSNVGKSRSFRQPVIDSFHPWCFPAGVVVETERGKVAIEDVTTEDLVLTHRGRFRRVTQIHENQWSGHLIDVNGTYSTPSHPFLTSRGWMPAESLEDGDNLIRAGSDIRGPESNNGPSSLFEIPRLSAVLELLSSGLVPVSPVDLDSKFELSAPEVDIEALHSQERLEGNSLCDKHRVEHAFQVREFLRLFDGTGSVDSFGQRLRTSLAGFVRIGDAIHRLLFGHLGIHVGASLTGGSPLEAVIPHVPGDGVSIHSENFGHFKHGSFLGVVKPAQQFLGEILSTGHGHLTRTLHHKCRKSTRWHEGHVYNLSVWGDESYVVDCKVVHNCACELIWMAPGFGFNSEGAMAYQRRGAA